MQHCGLYPSLIYSHSNQLKEKVNFVNYKQDTLYSLLMYDLETGYIDRVIWNKRGKVSYSSLGKKIKEYNTDVFMNRLYDIVENWESRVIEKGELNANKKINDGGIYSAMRVIILNNRIFMKCKNFREIYDFKLDELQYNPK